MTELAQIGADTSPATGAYRARIRQTFKDIYDQRTATQAELQALTTAPASVGVSLDQQVDEAEEAGREAVDAERRQ